MYVQRDNALQRSSRAVCVCMKKRVSKFRTRSTRERGTLVRLGVVHKLGTKDLVPEGAGDSEAVLVVEEVVGKVVLLESLVVGGQVLVVEEVVGHVVKGVAEDTAAEGSRGGVPVEEEDGVGKLPEGSSQDDEEGGRHDKAVLVHGQVVVDAVKEEMGSNADAVIGKVARKEAWLVLVFDCRCDLDGNTH